jgi:hypothetical protein
MLSINIIWTNSYLMNIFFVATQQVYETVWYFIIKTRNCRKSNMYIIKTLFLESASKLYRGSDCRLSAKLVPTFADRGYYVVSAMDSYGRILGFLDWSRYFFFQVAPQLYSRSWLDHDPDPLLLRKSGSAGSLTRTSGSLVRKSDH